MKHVISLPIIMAVYLITNTDLLAQSIIKRIQVRDHRNNETRQVFKIDVMATAKNDGKYQKAKQNQGVIGNDFYTDFEIGMAQNDNPWQISGTATDYQPIDGFKRTLTGKLLEHYIYDGHKDHDFNFRIVVDPNHDLLVKHQNNIKRVNHGGMNNGKPWNEVHGEIEILMIGTSIINLPTVCPAPVRCNHLKLREFLRFHNQNGKTMKQSKFSDAQIVAILGSVGKDKSVENVCREHGISPATFYT
ncbi:MAG: transposase [Spirosomataceae bacterium]